MKKPKTLRTVTGIDTSHQIPLLEYFDNRWHVWLSYDRDKETGTYLALNYNGSILRMTVHETGEITNVVTIAPPLAGETPITRQIVNPPK